MVTVVMEMMLTELRSRFVDRGHQSAHRLLVALETVRLLQLGQGAALTPTPLLRARKRLPGTLFLHQR